MAIRFRRFPFSYASSDRTDHRRRFASGDSPSTMRRSSSRASSDDEYFGESPSQSSPGESPSRSSGESPSHLGNPRHPGESPTRSSGESPSRSSPGESPSRSSPGESPSSWRIPITVFSCPRSGDGGFHSSEFPDYHASPSHPCFSFPSIVEIIRFLLLWTWLKRFPSRSDSPVIFRMGRLATPFSILSTSLKGSQIRPLRGRNWRRIPTSMRSMLETHSLLTWSVMAFIRKLHDRNLLPKDDQIISQLQKSFSKAYGNLAFGLSSSAVFVTLKRRQLLSLVWCLQSPMY